MKMELKDAIATAFGYLIAYVLPGLVGLYGLAHWYAPLGALFDAFLADGSSLSLLILLLLGAILLSMELVALRWLLFDRLICRKESLKPQDFAKLSTDNMIAAFQVAVDHHYRYHQFWGCMVFSIPLLAIALMDRPDATAASIVAVGLGGAILEGVTLAAAVDAYSKYVARAHEILKGG